MHDGGYLAQKQGRRERERLRSLAMLGSLRSLAPRAVLDALLDALESAGIGCTIVLDRGDRLERAYANEAICRIFGRDAQSMAELPPLVPLPPAERERLVALRASLKDQAKGALAFETAIVHASGASVPVEVGLAFVPLEDTRATIAFLRDVSANVAMAAQLRASEQRFRSLAEASPDSITVVANGKFVYANPIALAHLGLTSEELENVSPATLTPPDRIEATAAYMAAIARGESVPPVEYRVVAPNGKETVFEASMCLTSMGGVPAIVSYTRDITERVQMQAELMKQDRLVSVGLLAAGVAHEINNPLTALAMQARKLRENADKLQLAPEARLAAEHIDEAASRMRAIIDDLLFMARPVEKPQVHVDVAQIVSSTIALLRAGSIHLPVTLVLDALPPIRGFASKLGQVFLNVLRNAAQAIEGKADGEIRVCAGVAGDFVSIVVTDNGPGIPSDLLARVTTPFFTTKPQGMGLGLWISQALMADQGGALELASTEGSGTAVTLRIPIASI
jgi:PAS domain S-box-containing protein